MRSRNWFARVVITTWAGHFVPVALLASDSLIARKLAIVGAHGYGLIVALAIITSISLLDSIVNDALPAQFHFSAMNYRHIGFMGMSIILVLLGAMVANQSSPIVLLSFLLPAFFAVWITWLDIFDRHRPCQGAPA